MKYATSCDGSSAGLAAASNGWSVGRMARISQKSLTMREVHDPGSAASCWTIATSTFGAHIMNLLKYLTRASWAMCTARGF